MHDLTHHVYHPPLNLGLQNLFVCVIYPEDNLHVAFELEYIPSLHVMFIFSATKAFGSSLTWRLFSSYIKNWDPRRVLSMIFFIATLISDTVYSDFIDGQASYLVTLTLEYSFSSRSNQVTLLRFLKRKKH